MSKVNRSYLVTGGAGFLGSHLAEKLLVEDQNVIVVDNFCSGLRRNILELQKKYSERFLFVEADVVDTWDWTEAIPETWLKSLRTVFHFASPASPRYFESHSLEIIKVNTQGLERAIQFADQWQARVVFASSSEVYGDAQFSPQKENYWGNVNCNGPRACYDEAKRMGETIIFAHNQRNKTQHGMVRIFNTYGPRMNPEDGRVVVQFLVDALKGQSLKIHGDGAQTRSFCFVDDLIEGILKYDQKEIAVPLNLGRAQEISILEVASLVIKMFPHANLNREYRVLPINDPKNRKPDLALAHELLSPWKSEIELAEGLQKTLEWLRDEVHL